MKFATSAVAALLVLLCCSSPGDAFVLHHSNGRCRTYHHSFLSPLASISEREAAASSSTNTDGRIRPDLPDYGKTPIDIDQIRLEEKQKPWRRPDLFGTTLADRTMMELENDPDFQATAARLEALGVSGMTKEERTRRRRALDALGVPSFTSFLQEKAATVDTSTTSATSPVLRRKTPEVLQINIGLYCNQACAHCHVESSPLRTTEMMTAETAAQCLELLKNTPSITTLDITGGAPELNDHFRYLVSMAREIRGDDLDIIDRCNLTVLQEPGQEDLVEFLKQHKVHIIASLPCYSTENVDKQRGNGVFERSIAALLALNEAGYGHHSEDDHVDLQLDLVYNPLGAFLPPAQSSLEAKYKEVLQDNFGILFDSLYTITNMPIKRFADFLYRRDELQEYMDLLVRNFNVDTTQSLMCLNTVSIGWDGKIYDCDFNQQLGMGITTKAGEGGGTHDHTGEQPQQILSVHDITSLNELTKFDITNDNHCFGCTAGMGSS